MKNPSIRKPSVTFDLFPISAEEEEEKEHDPAISPNIDIHAQAIPDSIMVGLVDRSAEMRELTRCNSTYFQTLQHYLEDQWPSFEEILYSERSKIPDSEWMEQISNILEDNPPLLESFRELVGYIEDVSQEEEEEDEDSDLDKLVCLRESREDLDGFVASHSQFFENCKENLNGNEYNIFIKTLYTSRDKLSDEEWKSTIHDQFKKQPNLLGQL